MRWGGSASRDDAADLRYAKPTPSRLATPETRGRMTSEVEAAVIGLAD